MPGGSNQKSEFFEIFSSWMFQACGINMRSISDYVVKNTRKVAVGSAIGYVLIHVAYQNFRLWRDQTDPKLVKIDDVDEEKKISDAGIKNETQKKLEE